MGADGLGPEILIAGSHREMEFHAAEAIAVCREIEVRWDGPTPQHGGVHAAGPEREPAAQGVDALREAQGDDAGVAGHEPR